MHSLTNVRRAAVVLTAAALAATTLLALAPSAGAVTDVGGVGVFELDGNTAGVAPVPPADWEDLFTSTGANKAVSLSPAANLIQRSFVPDSALPDPSYFASNGGGVKDIAPISSWGCKSQNTPTPKDDVFNAYAMLAEVTAAGPRQGHLILYVGSERQQNQGDAFAGFWINQNDIKCPNPAAGVFAGGRTDGDLLLVADYKSGGLVQQLAAYEWTAGNTSSTSTSNLTVLDIGTGSNNADCSQVSTTANLCATTNGANLTTPWAPAAARTPGTFVEAGLDLTAIYAARNQAVPCFSQLFAETRSSEQLTATLKDYAEESFNTCKAPDISTTLRLQAGAAPAAGDASLAPPNNTVTLPANVYDTAAITNASGTPAGTVTYKLYTNSTCTTASTAPALNSTVTIAADGTIPPSSTVTFDQPGSWWFQADYSGAGRNFPAKSDCATEPLVVVKPSPAIATTPSAATIVIGNANSFSDTATITGGYFPAGGIAPGTVSFSLYGPFATAGAISCAGTPVFTSNNVAATRVNDTTATATSASFTPTAVGVYQWVASYSGNAQNNGVTAGCPLASEQVTVTPATPGIATKILLSDKVQLTGITGAGVVSGTATFTLYGPFATVGGISCTGTPVATPETRTLVNGGAQTQTPIAVVAGVYAWGVTFSSSNPNYGDTSSSCTAEVAAVSYQAPSPAN